MKKRLTVVLLLITATLFALTATAVSAADAVAGDVNGDGVFGLPDVTLTLQYLAEWDVALDEDYADVNGDGEISLKDVTLMLQYLAEWDVTLSFPLSEEGIRMKGLLDTIEISTLTSESPEKIKYSLYLPSEIEGSAEGDILSWQSDNTAVITNSGRVIRPWSDKDAETVILTATMRHGEESVSRKFTFTVQPDGEYTDPQSISSDYMSDEEFFGYWDGSQWLLEGKFDYSREELKDIEAAVKEGDYDTAAVALLEYMRGRDVESPVGLDSRADGYVRMRLDDIYATQHIELYQGEADIEATEYTEVSIPIAVSAAAGGQTTYTLMARYNESSNLVVLSKESGHGAKIALTVNGEERFYPVDADAMVRMGKYSKTNYGSDEEMTVSMFGKFRGDDTSRVVLRFSFTDLTANDVVTSARLIITAKVTPSFAGAKSIIVLLERNNGFDESTVCYNNLLGYVYNYNGVSGGTDWEDVDGSDNEYIFQMPRFYCWSRAARAYKETGDEWYAYKMIRQMMDFIYDKGYTMASHDVSWGVQNLRGGWLRTLDTAERLRYWSASFDVLVQSEYMTPDCCKTILKQIWDMNDVLLRSKVTSNNWAQNEGMAILQGALTFPEFSKAEEWMEYGIDKNESLIYKNHNDDGSYSEATAGYSISAYNRFIEFKSTLIEYGLDTSEEYDEMLHKAAYYHLLLRGPGGEELVYGDGGPGTSRVQHIPSYLNWFGDTDLQFIDTFGASGTEPSWTSKLFPDVRMTMMRANWTTTSPYIFTNVRGAGSHGDEDDNNITLIAYGRTLLTDAGIFSYTSDDPYRVWGCSTEAHNTVEINGKTQSDEAGLGTVHNWITTSAFDFLSQSSDGYSYLGIEHRRTITFIKPNIVIVSDLMTPEDETSENSYKQTWHMLPTSGLSTDADNHIIRSNFASGANIIVASADEDSETVKKLGWYDYGYQSVSESYFGYFGKTSSGKTTFDTVLIPYEQEGATVEVERVELDTDTSSATALFFASDVDGIKSMTYYMLNYDCDGSFVKIEGCESDAMLTVVRFAEDGYTITGVIIAGGSKVAGEDDGEVFVDCGKTVESFAYEVDGGSVTVTTSEDSAEGMMICVDAAVTALSVNGKAVSFTQNGTEVVIGG